MIGEHNHLADREKWVIKRVLVAQSTPRWCEGPQSNTDCREELCLHQFPQPHGDLRYDADCSCGARIVAFLSQEGWRVEPLTPTAGKSVDYRPR